MRAPPLSIGAPAPSTCTGITLPDLGSSADVQLRGDTLIAHNKRASFDFDLGDRFEAGVVLRGVEVKLLRAGRVHFAGAFCTVSRGEAFLHGMRVTEGGGSALAPSPKDARKLLLHQSEIERLTRALEREGMTAVATRLYFKGSWVKVELRLARGKKSHDKREAIKKKDLERDLRAGERARSKKG
jgi:SsrA-binding protein